MGIVPRVLYGGFGRIRRVFYAIFPRGLTLYFCFCPLILFLSWIHVNPAVGEEPKLVQARSLDDILSFDPAESAEIGAAEIIDNVYERLLEPSSAGAKDAPVRGQLAESWSVSEDGRTVFFTLKRGHRFSSGHEVKADDVVFSLRRAILLGRAPAFTLSQFGISAQDVGKAIVQTGPYSLSVTMPETFSLPLFLSSLTANVGSVLDSALVKSKEEGQDLGTKWLRHNSAGSGPFRLSFWQSGEGVSLEHNPHYAGERPFFAEINYRHVGSSALRRLLLERGDVDIARGLAAEDVTFLEKRGGISLSFQSAGTLIYIGLNSAHPQLAHPEVQEALKYLVDYETLIAVFTGGRALHRQVFLPSQTKEAIHETPYRLDVEKARGLLERAGFPKGFKLSMDVRNAMPFLGIAQALQQSFALGGIKLELRPLEQAQLLTRYRGRQHEMVLAHWGLRYPDPHANAQGFAFNPDNGDQSPLRSLAWRNSWYHPSLNDAVLAGMRENDPQKRAALYAMIQREVLSKGPFIILYEGVDNSAFADGIKGVSRGTSPDSYDFSRARRE